MFFYELHINFIIFAHKLILIKKIMENFIYGYEKPEIEIVEISVEKGFNVSEPGVDNEDGGWG